MQARGQASNQITAGTSVSGRSLPTARNSGHARSEPVDHGRAGRAWIVDRVEGCKIGATNGEATDGVWVGGDSWRSVGGFGHCC